MGRPDAVTLVPGADATALAARIDTAAPGASAKDSFADLDLTEAGFPTLPLVGYEHGDDWAAAVRHGFEPVAPLRTWPHGWTGFRAVRAAVRDLHAYGEA